MSAWDLSCLDWRERLIDGRSLVPTLPLNIAAADRAVSTFNKFRLPDVHDRPQLEEAGADWFRDIVRAIFGSFDPQIGMRRVSNAFVLVPKKNAKTTYSAALMLTALLLNRRPNARFGLFGPTQEIALIAFNAVTNMIAIDPDLAKLFHVQDSEESITNRVSGAVLKVTTFHPSVATGGLYAGWLLDELHLASKIAFTSRVIGQLRGARVAIPEAFGVIITTQSEEPPAGAFKEELQYARAVRDGREASGGLLPVLYEFPEAMQVDRDQPWLRPEVWQQVLPNFGRSVSLAVLESDLIAAKAKGPGQLRIWASQHLNIEIGMALHSERWRGADEWESSVDKALTLDDLIERSEVVTVGIDGGGLDDLLGFAVIGRCKVTKRWLHWGHAWVDRSVLDLRKEIASSLVQFAEAGELTFVDIGAGAGLDDLVEGEDGVWRVTGDEDAALGQPGADARGRHGVSDRSGADQSSDPVLSDRPAAPARDTSYLDPLVAVVKRLWLAGLLPEKYGIGLDPVGVAAIQQALIDADIPPDCLSAVPQGYRLSGTVSGVGIRLKAGTFRHCGQALMAWCVGNAKAELKGSAILITKQTAGAAKIDPLMALFDAAFLMAMNPQSASPTSAYTSVAKRPAGLLVI